jgi:hypothetical protein
MKTNQQLDASPDHGQPKGFNSTHQPGGPTLSVFCLLPWLSVASAFGQSGGSYLLTNSTVDSGASFHAGGQYLLSGTVGQHDVGEPSGGDYVLTGGFWSPSSGPSPIDILWDPNQQRTRSLTFTAQLPASATGGGTSAIRIVMLNLQNPMPPNNNPAGPCCPPPSFVSFDTVANAVCTAGSESAGYRCTAPGDCVAPSTCMEGVGCTELVGADAQGGCARWVGPPFGYLESNDNSGQGNYRAARLQCTPYYHDWASEPNGLVNVIGAEILPSSSYSVQAYGPSCAGSEIGCSSVSPAVTLTTHRAGDIAAPYQTPSPPLIQPNALDVTASVNKFRNVAGAPSKTVAHVQPNFPDPNADFNAIDVVTVVDNVRGFGYPYSGPCVCPSTVPCGLTACSNASACTGLYGPGATCIKTCTSGPRTGQPCNTNLNCGSCVGGPATGHGAAGIPCDADSDCASNNCGLGVCPTGPTPGFCRDRCGRCAP